MSTFHDTGPGTGIGAAVAARATFLQGVRANAGLHIEL